MDGAERIDLQRDAAEGLTGKASIGVQQLSSTMGGGMQNLLQTVARSGGS
jgi:hypothetical protein